MANEDMKALIKKEINWEEKNKEITKHVAELDFYANVHPRWGVGRFSHLFWWDIEVNAQYLKDEFKDYTDILLAPYRVDEDLLKEIAVEESGVWSVKVDS